VSTTTDPAVRTLLSFTGCQRCGNCCRVRGYVRLTTGDVDVLTDVLGLPMQEFTSRFTRLTRERTGLSLIEKDDGSCIFLDAGGACKVHSAKPKQCRDFPTGWRFPNAHRTCPALHMP